MKPSIKSSSLLLKKKSTGFNLLCGYEEKKELFCDNFVVAVNFSSRTYSQ